MCDGMNAFDDVDWTWMSFVAVAVVVHKYFGLEWYLVSSVNWTMGQDTVTLDGYCNQYSYFVVGVVVIVAI